jgi:hypothetical protein
MIDSINLNGSVIGSVQNTTPAPQETVDSSEEIQETTEA